MQGNRFKQDSEKRQGALQLRLCMSASRVLLKKA